MRGHGQPSGGRGERAGAGMNRNMRDYAPPAEEYPDLPPEIAPPGPEITPEGAPQPTAEKPNRRRRLRLLLYAAAALVYLGLLYEPVGDRASEPSAAPTAPVQIAAPVQTAAPAAEPDAAPTAQPAPESPPTPEESGLTLERVSGTYKMSGLGVLTGDSRFVYTETGTQTSNDYSAIVTIAPGGEGVLVMNAVILGKKEFAGEGPYTWDEGSGAASFADANGLRYTLVFAEEDGRITLDITMFADYNDVGWDVTETVTLTGARTSTKCFPQTETAP